MTLPLILGAIVVSALLNGAVLVAAGRARRERPAFIRGDDAP